MANHSMQLQTSAVVSATIYQASNTSSPQKKEEIKAKLKHLIRKQMLNTLDKIKTNADKSHTKYPKLKYYDDYENNVKQFFIEYRIFDKLADIFFSMQGNMHQLFPSQKLMLPIKLDLNDQNKKNEFGSNFTCLYDYLSGNNYLYFTSDQLKNGINTTFIRRALPNQTNQPMTGGNEGEGRGTITLPNQNLRFAALSAAEAEASGRGPRRQTPGPGQGQGPGPGQGQAQGEGPGPGSGSGSGSGQGQGWG